MPFKLSLAQKGFLLVAVPLAFELACVGMLFGVWQESRNQAARQMHDREIVAVVNHILQLTMNTATTALFTNVFNDAHLHEEKESIKKELQASFVQLREMVKDDPVQRKLTDRASTHLQKLITASMGFNLMNELSAQEKMGTLLKLNAEIHTFNDTMSELLRAQAKDEKAWIDAQQASQQTINIILLTLIISSISLAVGLAFYFNSQAARRLGVVMSSISSLSQGKYGSLPLAGDDEFARLDRDIHGLAAQLLNATHKERAVLENAQDVIFSIDTRGQFTAVNPAAERVWGYPQAKLLGMTISDLLTQEKGREVIQQLRDTAANQKPCVLEVVTVAADKRLIEQTWSVTWSKLEQTLFCVAHDISERKRIEKMKQEFVAMITHDLRTPLASIKAVLEVLAAQDSGLNPEWRERVNRSAESSARLISLINDLLDLEKMQAGKLEIEPDICIVDDLIASSIAAVASFAEGRNITVDYKNTGLMVEADERRVVQVIVNLLSNAIKFSPQSSQVKVSSTRSADMVEVRVSDQGRGIPQDKLKDVFSRFTQVSDGGSKDKTQSRESQGTGLGLAICQEIISAHGGQIGVESQENAGSTFWFKLPAADT
ncbi:MAG: PAS domain S-box protein [Cyanobacteria bacterium SZAS LIN-3]|nr:PAS domain S-box protein [Cyanobacteria bacterium SZAS LIN-3]MBS2008907.1 PAS domain S-box protein [Cyanobacteria bacterium SZAS TMP-1]